MKQVIALIAVITSTFIAFGFKQYSESSSSDSPERASIPSESITSSAPTKFNLPDGFSVEQVAGPDLVGSPVAITFDSKGQLVVAKEFDKVVTLKDTDNDGVYDDSIVFSDQINTSQGVLFDGQDLIVTANGPQGVGLYRVYDFDGDSRGDSISVLGLEYRRIEDHGAHNLKWGPDGYLYWAGGNAGGIYSSTSPMSPVRNYKDASILGRIQGFWPENRTPGGKFYRKHPAALNRVNSEEYPGASEASSDFSSPSVTSDWELFAMGFRNIYDGAFNMMGELFTFDSDMEPDLGLPWYRPVRSDHVVPGGDYGYREGSMIHPAYYYDNLPPMEDEGRGSPTGVITYEAYNYPAKYSDMLLQCDWSRGRILMGLLTKDGASYTQNSETDFVEATPLNVTDIAVGPDGNIYFSLGGRRTEGGIYRVVYNGPDAMKKPEVNSPIDEVLTMIQPRSAYSRKKAQDIKDQIGDQAWKEGLTAVVNNAQASPERRVRAMELLMVYGPGMDLSTLNSLTNDSSWKVRASATYYLGIKQGVGAQRTLVRLLHDDDPFVQRRAAEALLRTGLSYPLNVAPISAVDDVFPLLASSDQFVRYAGRELLRELNPNSWREQALKLDTYPQATEALMAYLERDSGQRVMYDFGRFINRGYELLKEKPSGDNLLDVVRYIEVTIAEDPGVRVFPVVPSTPEGINIPSDTTTQSQGGGGFLGGGNQVYDRIGEELLARFPTGDWRIDREISKTLAALDTPGAVDKIMAALNSEGDLLQQIHYANVLGYMKNGWDENTINQMTDWYVKMYKQNHGGLRYLSLMQDDFLDNIPGDQRSEASDRIAAVQPKQPQGFGPGRGGPAGQMSDVELKERVGNLVYNPSSFDADVNLGAWAFQKALCSSCHTFGSISSATVGPDLTTVGQRLGREQLVRSVAYPSETISSQYEATTITRNNGDTVSGTVVKEDATEIIIQVPLGPQVTIPKSDVKSRINANSQVSMMPEGLLGLLSNQEQEALFLLLQQGPSAIPDSALARINGK